MKIPILCPKCAQEYSVNFSQAGKKFSCKKCEAVIQIPTKLKQATELTPAEDVQNSGRNDFADSAIPVALANMLAKNLAYEKSTNFGEIQADMDHLHFFDKHHEDKEKKHRLWMILFIVATLALGFLACICFLNLSFLIVSAGILCVAGALTCLVYAVIHGRALSVHSRLNLDDKRYRLMSELTRLISVDMSETEALNARLVFGRHDRDEAFVKKGEIGYWNVNFFVNEWFALTGRLLDGSKFSFSIKEKQQNRSRTSRSASGKTKHKTKVKNAEEILMIVRPKEKRYPHLEKLVPEAAKALQIPGYAELKSFKFQQSSIVLKLSIRELSCHCWGHGENIDQQVKERVNLLAMMLLSVYQLLNLCRDINKKSNP
ncbi:hypothetical protein N8639_00015 [bacterium]|nr:hypothetical protein [bacterium]